MPKFIRYNSLHLLVVFASILNASCTSILTPAPTPDVAAMKRNAVSIVQQRIKPNLDEFITGSIRNVNDQFQEIMAPYGTSCPDALTYSIDPSGWRAGDVTSSSVAVSFHMVDRWQLQNQCAAALFNAIGAPAGVSSLDIACPSMLAEFSVSVGTNKITAKNSCAEWLMR